MNVSLAIWGDASHTMRAPVVSFSDAEAMLSAMGSVCVPSAVLR